MPTECLQRSEETNTKTTPAVSYPVGESVDAGPAASIICDSKMEAGAELKG